MRNLQPSEQFFMKNLVVFWLVTGQTVHNPPLGTPFVRLDPANSLTADHRSKRCQIEVPDVVRSELYVFSWNIRVVPTQRVCNLVPEVSVQHAAR